MQISTITQIAPAASMTTVQLVEALTLFNEAYRTGAPLVTDQVYDHEYMAELKRREPNHPFLIQPEPEPVADGNDAKRFRHTAPMLSTDKCYETAEVQAWCDRISKACAAVGVDVKAIQIRITAKLDGVAARRYPAHLVTRGKNGFGNDISPLLTAGLVYADSGVDVSGEIVVDQDYFTTVLASSFDLDHPRSYVAGLVGADTLKEHHTTALEAGKVVFQTYRTLPAITTTVAELPSIWEASMLSIQNCPYLCDGAIAEIVSDAAGAPVIAELGATSHHNNWVMALKRNAEDEIIQTTVTRISAAAARTGRITPVIHTAGDRIGGVLVTNYTAHHVRNLLDKQMGVGAVLRCTRSGGVIPTILSVVTPAKVEFDIDHCPSCGGLTEFDGPYLVCPNTATCVSQAAATIGHFFKTTAVCRGFGPAICDTLVAAGITRVSAIYRLGVAGFIKAGISPGVAANLQSELDRSRSEPLSDAVFLGAFGLRSLGRGDSRRLLKHVAIEDLASVTPEMMQTIDGFGESSSRLISKGLATANAEIQDVLSLGFNLERTPRGEVGGPLSGKVIVFTGTMSSGDRKTMEDTARKLGATVGSSVTGKTSMLVCGADVGESKTSKATKLKVAIVSEAEYLQLIASA